MTGGSLDVASGAGEAPTVHLGRDVSNVVLARRWLMDSLRGAGAPEERVAEAGVVISELVTNVLTHTTSEATVALRMGARSAHVSVHDADGGMLPVLRPVDPTRIGGNGIRILDAFSTAWGCDVVPLGGKDVWFQVAW